MYINTELEQADEQNRTLLPELKRNRRQFLSIHFLVQYYYSQTYYR